MLQINTGKLFTRGIGRTNCLTGVLYTNLRLPHGLRALFESPMPQEIAWCSILLPGKPANDGDATSAEPEPLSEQAGPDQADRGL